MSAYDFWVQQGAYRHKTRDLAKWGAYNCRFTEEKRKTFKKDVCHEFPIASWNTMTECVKMGVNIEHPDDLQFYSSLYLPEVHAKETR